MAYSHGNNWVQITNLELQLVSRDGVYIECGREGSLGEVQGNRPDASPGGGEGVQRGQTTPAWWAFVCSIATRTRLSASNECKSACRFILQGNIILWGVLKGRESVYGETNTEAILIDSDNFCSCSPADLLVQPCVTRPRYCVLFIAVVVS